MTSRTLTPVVGAALSLLLLPAIPLAEQSSAGGDPHRYFATLVSRRDHVVSYSLRDPAQLAPRAKGGFSQSDTRELGVTYAPAADTYPRKQDAAKVVIQADANSLRNQIRLPLLHEGRGFLVTWDAWWGEEFFFDRSGIEDYKAFQLESGGRIWTEVRARFRRATRFPGAVALVDVRPYQGSSERRGAAVGGTKYGNGSLGGLLANFPIAPNTWTRYWIELVPRGDGGWWDLSMWVADEKRDATQLYDRQAVKPNGTGWDRLWLEYNTSTKARKPGRGELVAYARNVVVLRSPGDGRPALDRPHGNSAAPSPGAAPTGRRPRKTTP